MNANNVNDRLSQSAQGGSPQVDPDQQRKYLGTFRERVSLAIPVKDMQNKLAQQALAEDIKKTGGKYVVIINSNFNCGAYMVLCNKYHVPFTMESDSNYADQNLSYGIVYAARQTPINISPVVWYNKYPNIKGNQVEASDKKSKPRLINKIKHLF